MKKLISKILTILLIVPALFIFISCNTLTSSDKENTEDNIETILPGEDLENNGHEENNPSLDNDQDIETDQDAEAPENPDDSNDTQEDESINEDQTETPSEPEDKPSSIYNISFEMMSLEELPIQEIFNNPQEVFSVLPEIALDSNDGVLYYAETFSMDRFAIHFKNKDGLNITTVEENGEMYLKFDIFVQTFYLQSLSININNETITTDLTTMDHIYNMDLCIYKITYDLKITEDTKITLDLTNLM